MRASEASGAEEALDLLREGAARGDPFRAAVLDYQMPGMDGRALGRILMEDPALRGTVRILLSSLGGEGGCGEEQEFAACLAKPARPRELREALIRALRGASKEEREGTPRRASGDLMGRFAGRKGRILLVEDNPVNQQVALGILGKLGLRARAAGNGAEALAALEEEDFDLVLLDVQMPVMDGLEAARSVRDPGSSVRDHRIPLIAMTAHAMQGDREACLAAGMDDYLPKPVKPGALAELLERWLPQEPGEEGME